jgi:hypothetical protein
MLVAGEEIDHLFGIRLGLSTLASAGLGNAVAVSDLGLPLRRITSYVGLRRIT